MNNLCNKVNPRLFYGQNYKNNSEFDYKDFDMNYQNNDDFEIEKQNNTQGNEFNENLTFHGVKDIKELIDEKLDYQRYNIEYNLFGFDKEKDEKDIKRAIIFQFKNNDNNDEIFIGKKKNREKNIKIHTQYLSENDEYLADISKNYELINDEINLSSCIKLKENEKVKLGRKKLNSIKNGKHNKFSDDNIINKIKGNFLNYFIRDIIKKFSIKKKIDIKKLPRDIISDLNKKRNEKLYKTKLSDFLLKNKISSKYTSCDEYENKKIIKNIYKEKKEKKVMKILELTFEELFVIFRRKLNDNEDKKKLKEIYKKIEGLNINGKNNNYKDIVYLIEFINKKYKEKMSENELDEYIRRIKSLCLGYEKWFNNKIGRTCRKQYDS